MNDHDLDRLVASAAPVLDAWLDGLDLRDAENELMEEIMATGNAATAPSSVPPTTDAPATEPSSLHGTPHTPRAERRTRRFRLALAAGLVAATLVGTVLVRATGGDGDDDRRGDVQAGSQGSIRPMVADPLPDGFGVSIVSPEEGTGPESTPPGPPDTWVYGDLTATAITNDVVIRIAPREPEGDILGDDVTVRGAEGNLCSPGPNQCDFGNNFTEVSWTEGPGLWISVESRSFDREQMLAIAEGLVIEDGTIELGDLPAGVTEPPKVAELDDGWAGGYTVQYASPTGGHISVSTRAETEATRAYGLWLSGPRSDAVQGRPAAFEDIDGSYVLTWEPVDGQLVEVLTSGMDEAGARAFAETVRPATAAEWAEVQDQAGSVSFPENDLGGIEAPPDDAVHRPLADGSTEVWGWRNDDGGLCYEVHLDGNPSSNACGGDLATDVLGVSPTNDDGVLTWDVPAAVGVAPDGTVSIDGGEVTLGEDVEGGRLFVWEFTDGEMPDELTFRDAGGDELATAEVLVF